MLESLYNTAIHMNDLLRPGAGQHSEFCNMAKLNLKYKRQSSIHYFDNDEKYIHITIDSMMDCVCILIARTVTMEDLLPSAKFWS